MPSIVIHESQSNPAHSNLKLRQLSSSFTMQPNGFIEVPIQYLITPTGLSAAETIKKLLPKAGNKLDEDLYNVRNLPKNRGLFVKSCQMVYENGLHYANIVCVSCTDREQAVVNCDFSTTTFTLGIEGIDENGETVIKYCSFQAKIPTISIQHCCLVGEENQKVGGVSVTMTTSQKIVDSYSQIQVIAPYGDYSKGFSYRFRPYNITNRNTFNDNRSYFDLLESQSVTSDGSVVQVTNQHSVQIITNED